MTEKEKFISDKMRILVGKENYSRPQAYQIALSYYEKEGHKAQQGTQWYENNPPMFTTSYGQSLPQTPTAQTQEQYNASQGYDPKMGYTDYMQGDANADGVVNQEDAITPYTQNSVNIMNPYGTFGNPMYNLNQGMYNLGKGNTGLGIAGLGAFGLGAIRTGLLGYSTGKEDRRVAQEYDDKRFDRTPNYTAFQQGGVKNSDIIAQNAITDQGIGNINLESDEFVMRTNGQVQPVVGDKHIENGKKADGVNAQLNDGDKVLSNYVKLKPADIKDLKERYDISLKRGTTFADAQKKLDQKLGIKKLETEKADILEKIEKATKIKDDSSKQLSLEVLTQKTGDVNEKLNTLSGIRANNFEFLFERQERQPKKGSGTELYDKNGKEVTESKEEVAQQGLQYTTKDQSYGAQRVSNVLNSGTSDDNMGINLRKIKNIQGGVTNDKLGSGYYIYYDKLPTEAGFDPNRNREFVTQEAYTNTVLRAPAYQEYMRNLSTPTNDQRIATEEFQQGGIVELARKHNISPERAQELMQMQQGGIQSEQEEQGEISQEQVFQAVAQMVQGGENPNTIIETLIQQGVGHEEAMQIVQQVMQQMQGQMPQEEQAEGNEQEEEMEVAQQGGEKKYYQQAGTYTKKDQQERLNDFYNQVSGLGYEGKKDIGAMQTWMADNYPDEVVNYFTTNGQPLTAKHVDIIKNKYKNAFEETGIPANKKSEDYTAEEKAKLQTALGDKANKEFLLEGFKDNKWDWRFPMVSQKPIAPIQGIPNPQIAAPNMDRFYLPENPQVSTQTEEQANVEAPQKEIQASGVKNIMPNFGTYIPLFSPMSPISKETVEFSRAEPIKVTPESMLAEQARQNLAQVERIEQSGLSPQQQAAVLGQSLSSSQLASNDAISKAEQYNAQNQFAVDQYNLGAKTKEDIMNAQFRQDYQGKALQTLANQQTDIENKYRSNFLQNVANQNKVVNMNTANALNNQFAITSEGVIPLNNKPAEFKNDYVTLENFLKNATPEQLLAFKKAKGLESTQGITYNPSTNTEMVNNIYGNKAIIAKNKSKK